MVVLLALIARDRAGVVVEHIKLLRVLGVIEQQFGCVL